MSVRPQPTSANATLPLGRALDQSAPLARLLQQMQASKDCLAAILPALPEGLCTQLTAGPLDDSGWSILAANGAAASKLRQMLPTLETLLRERALPGTPIRIKVQP